MRMLLDTVLKALPKSNYIMFTVMFPSNKLFISSWKAARLVKHLSPLWIYGDNNQSPFCHHLEMSSSLQLVPTVLWIFLFHLSEDTEVKFSTEIMLKHFCTGFSFDLQEYLLDWSGEIQTEGLGEKAQGDTAQQPPHILWVLFCVLLDWHQAEKNAQSLSKKSLYDTGIKNAMGHVKCRVTTSHIQACRTMWLEWLRIQVLFTSVSLLQKVSILSSP